MRLESYEPKVQPNTPAGGGAQGPTNLSAYGNTAESYANAIKAFDDWKEVAIKKQETEMKLQAMNAQTDYNRRIMDLLYNDKDGLAYTELKDASDSAQRFRDAEAKIRQEVLGNIQYVRSRDEFTQHADSMTTRYNTTMETHEREQGDKYKDVSFDNNVHSLKEMLQLGAYKNKSMLGKTLDDIKTTIQNVYGDRGEEYVNNLYNKTVNDIGKSLLITMQGKEDYDAITEAIPVLREKGMDEEFLSEAETKTNKIKFNLTVDKDVDSYMPTYGYDENGIQNAVKAYRENQKKITTGFDGSVMVGSARQWIGVPYVLGGRSKSGIDCAGFTKAVADSTGLHLDHDTADGQYIDFEKKGQIFTNASELKAGDFVFYHIPDNEAKWPTSNNPEDTNRGMAYKGVTHVGIYIGDGKVIQAGSSSGVTESPVQLSDDYTIVGYGRVSGMGQGTQSDARIEENTQKFEQAYREKAQKLTVIENQRIQQQMDSINATIYTMTKNGESAAAIKDTVASMIGDNPKLQAKAAGMMSGLASAARSEARAAARALGGGGSGGGSGSKMDAMRMNMAKEDIEFNGVSLEDEFKKLEEAGVSLSPSDVVELNKAAERARNGTGAKQYEGQLESYLGIIGADDNAYKNKNAILVASWPEIAQIKSSGREPTPDELNSIFASKIKDVNISWNKYCGLNRVIPMLGGNMAVKQYVLEAHGIKSAVKVPGDDGADYVRVTYKDGSTHDIWIEDFNNMYNNWTQ